MDNQETGHTSAAAGNAAANKAGGGKVIAGILIAALAFATMEAVLKLASAGLDNLQLTAVRFFIGGLILLPFGLAAKKRDNVSLSVKDHLWLLLLGTVCIPVSMMLFQVGVVHSNASTASVLFCINPLSTMVLAHFFANERMTKKKGIAFDRIPGTESGELVLDAIEGMIRPETVAIVMTHSSNICGTVNPLKEVGAICKKHGVLFHTDAVQAVGHLPINVKESGIDMLSASAHKFHGPRGIGFLYARKGVRLTNLIEGGAQERGKRAGTENVAAIAGMAAALKESAAHMEENAAHMSALRDRLIQGLSRIPHSALNGDAKKRLPGNVNFSFEGIEGESLLLLLDDRGICASSGSACTSGSLDPSHVLLAIGRVHDVAHGSLRLSLGEDATEEEVDYMIRNVSEVVEYLRSFSPVWRDLMSGKTKFIL